MQSPASPEKAWLEAGVNGTDPPPQLSAYTSRRAFLYRMRFLLNLETIYLLSSFFPPITFKSMYIFFLKVHFVFR